MTGLVEKRVAELEDRVAFLTGQSLAFQNVIMAQLEVLNELLPGTAAATAKKAELKRRAAAHMREHAWALCLESFVDQVRERFDLPANDG